MKVAIIGAGPAGMTAAYQLAKSGVEVDVYEASPNVGGLAKTLNLWGQRVDLGPHRFFSTDRRVNSLWLEVVGRDYKIVNRLTRIMYKEKFYAYPLRPLNALANLGIFEALYCVSSYIKQRLLPIKQGEGSFEDWVVGRFGRRLFNIFFKTYSEKLWGISCKQLDADFAAQRIKKLSLFEAVRHAIFPRKQIKHKTLIDQFAYPLEGTGMVYERMRGYVQSHGGHVHCSAPVSHVVTQQSKAMAIALEGDSVRFYDHIISSMPITQLVARLKDVPSEIEQASRSLKFRNTILVYLEVDAVDLFPDQWIYVHSPELQTGRITNFRNWVPSLYGEAKTTILAMEYWCYDEDALWSKNDEELIALARKEVRMVGLRAIRYLHERRDTLVRQRLVKGEFIEAFTAKAKEFKVLNSHVHRIRKCYPVYDLGYKQRLKPVEKYLSSIEGLSVIGRYGAFKYNNQDHSILMGILAAENILKQAHHDLWAVNTDYESYQENTIINDTGLASVS